MTQPASDQPTVPDARVRKDFRPVPGYQGRLWISRNGQVVVLNSDGQWRTCAQQARKNGHARSNFRIDGKHCSVYVARAVLLAWVGPPPHGRFRATLRDPAAGIRLDNLYWGWRPSRSGGLSPKLTDRQITALRRAYWSGRASRADLERRYGVSAATVKKYLARKVRADLTPVPHEGDRSRVRVGRRRAG